MVKDSFALPSAGGDAVLLRSLPVRDPHELRLVNWVGLNPQLTSYTGMGITDAPGGLQMGTSFPYPAYLEFRDRAQVGISVLLVAGAGLLLRTFANLASVDPGFDPQNMLLFRIDPGQAGYEGRNLVAFYDQTHAAISAIPGVQAVAFSGLAVASDSYSSESLQFPDREKGAGEDWQTAVLSVSEGFFRTMSIPLLAPPRSIGAGRARGGDWIDRGHRGWPRDPEPALRHPTHRSPQPHRGGFRACGGRHRRRLDSRPSRGLGRSDASAKAGPMSC